jgi:dolichol kinase
LAVCGAVADNRYKASGGKQEDKNWWKVFLMFLAFVAVLFVYLGYHGADAGEFGALTGNLFVWTFAGYELRRFLVRRANPLTPYQK